MNPEQEESENCPATVYSNHECTLAVSATENVGWMIWGRRKTIAIKLDGLWIPHSFAHRFPHTYPPALRTAA